MSEIAAARQPPPSSSAVEPQPSRLIVAATLVWPFVSLGIKVPFLVLYFRHIGLTESQIALLVGLGGVTVLLTQQIWGYLADVVAGRRRTLVIMSTGSAAATLLMPLSDDFGWVLLFFVLMATFTDTRMPLMNALLLRAGQGKPRGFGILRALGSVSFIITTIVVGLFIDWEHRLGIGWVFPLLAASNVIYAVTLTLRHERLPHIGKGGRPSFADVQRVLLARPAIRYFLLFVLVYQLPHNFSLMMQGVLMRDLGATFTASIAPILIGAVIELPALVWARDVLRRFPLMTIFLGCTLVQSLRWLLVGLFPITEVIYASNLLHLVTFGVMYISSVLFIDEELPEEFRSSGQSILNVCYMTVAITIGPLVSIVFFQVLGASLSDWYLAAGLIVLAALPALWLLHRAVVREHTQLRDAAIAAEAAS